MKTFLSITFAASMATSAFSSSQGLQVIYGEDNRRDVFESRDSGLVELSRSTAAMVPVENLKSRSRGEIELSGETLESRGVCASERFSKQISAANCSGFLVAPNILVTAGHCIKTEHDCTSNRWVFDYMVDYEAQRNITVPSASVYRCKRIISRSLDQTTKDDYAVIELDRVAANRRPLAFRRSGRISRGTPVAVIGHPSGLPTKIADGAEVRAQSEKYFIANLDTYGGNSGSAVFNVRTGEVEGILVRGENDYVYDASQRCQVSNRCPDTGCRGEDVTYITNVEALRDIR